MPIYEYRCDACGSTFEKLVFGSSPRVSCPSCGTDAPKRIPSSFGIGGGSAKGTTSQAGTGCSGCSRTSCAGCR